MPSPHREEEVTLRRGGRKARREIQHPIYILKHQMQQLQHTLKHASKTLIKTHEKHLKIIVKYTLHPDKTLVTYV
jgi:hypothetical protein